MNTASQELPESLRMAPSAKSETDGEYHHRMTIAWNKLQGEPVKRKARVWNHPKRRFVKAKRYTKPKRKWIPRAKYLAKGRKRKIYGTRHRK